MYTDPEYSRRGIGRQVLTECENRARRAGFTRIELMATLAGEPLYLARGYREIERIVEMVDGVEVPLVRMGHTLA
jgi:GNAT superfamily N-acetyltransferase